MPNLSNILPDELYYTQSTLEENYGEDGGTIEPDRILSGLAPFRLENAALEKLPKKLIVTLPSMSRNTIEENQQIFNCLTDLLESGFELYIGATFQKLSTDTLYKLLRQDIQRDMGPFIHEDELKRLAIAKLKKSCGNVTLDQITILNEPLLNRIMGGEEYITKVYSSYLLDLKEIDYERIYLPEQVEIISDTWIVNGKEIHSFNLKIVKDVFKIVLSTSVVNAKKYRICMTINGDEDLQNVTEILDQIKEFRSVDIKISNENLPLSFINDLLNGSNIRELNLDFNKVNVNFDIENFEINTNLERLKLDFTIDNVNQTDFRKLFSSFVQKIIQASPNIHTLAAPVYVFSEIKSEACIKNLTINFKDHGYCTNDTYMQRANKFLRKLAQELIYLSISGKDCFQPIFESWDDSTLECFEVSCHNSSSKSRMYINQEDLDFLPNIERLSLNYLILSCEEDCKLFLLSYAKIKSLAITPDFKNYEIFNEVDNLNIEHLILRENWKQCASKDMHFNWFTLIAKLPLKKLTFEAILNVEYLNFPRISTLKELNFFEPLINENIQHSSLPKIVANCENLETLSFCTSENEMHQLLNSLSTLHNNNLREICIDADSLEPSALAQTKSSKFDGTFPNLEVVKLCSISENSFNTIKALLSAAPNLKEFEFTLKNILDPGLINLINKNPGLKSKILELFSDYDGYLNIHRRNNINSSSEKKGSDKNSLNKNMLSEDSDSQTVQDDILPSHNPQNYQNNVDRINDEYSDSDNLNQTMLSNRLCKYLDIKQQNIHLKILLKRGMCLSLAHYFISKTSTNGLDAWQQFLTTLQHWNGSKKTLNAELEGYLQELLAFYQKYYLSPTLIDYSFITNNEILKDLLQQQENIILSNPWHAIAIKRKYNVWYMYDPNFTNGYIQQKNLNKVTDIIHRVLGNILMSPPPFIPPFSTIENHGAFFASGGLLALQQINVEQTKYLCQNLQEVLITKENLEQISSGLTIRNVYAEPAWFNILTNVIPADLENLTVNLIKLVLDQNPLFEKAILKSIEAITEHKLLEGKNILTHKLNRSEEEEHKEIYAALIQLIDVKLGVFTAKYCWSLQPSLYTALNEPDISAYYNSILYSERSLVILKKQHKVTAFALDLISEAEKMNLPVYFADSSKDLIVDSSYIVPDAINPDIGVVSRERPLEIFLQQNKHGIIIINCNNFSQDELVQHYEIFEQDGKIHNKPIPASFKIIALTTTKPDNAFHSRFTYVSSCPESIENSLEVPMLQASTKAITHELNLYESVNWLSQLLGNWDIDQNGQTYYKPGIINNLISTNTNNPINISINNGLWDDQEFIGFWQKLIKFGKIYHAGKIITIPPNFNFFRGKDTYDLDVTQIVTEGNDQAPVKLLNPTTVLHFFENCQYDEINNCLSTKEGYLQEFRNNTIQVILTRSISYSKWAKLLDECKKHNVQLMVYRNESVPVPEEISDKTLSLSNYFECDHTKVFVSDDIEITTLEKFDESTLVLDISASTKSELLMQLQFGFDEKTNKFTCTHSEGIVTKTLAEGGRVILKGEIPGNLHDELNALIHRRLQGDSTGELIIVLPKYACFGLLPVNEIQITSEQKLAYLDITAKEKDLLHKYAEKGESFNKLKARLIYMRAHQGHNFKEQDITDNAWAGFDTLPVLEKTEFNFDFTNSQQQTEEYIQERKELINQILVQQPYCYLTGHSGVGKTTFVLEELPDAETEVYIDINKWLEHQGSRKAILLVDEVNYLKNCDKFKNLFNPNPGIFHNNQYHFLTANHKVIFTSNPTNGYGNGRELANVFKEHGNASLFTPMPEFALYEKILKPIFSTIAEQLCEENIHIICRRFLEIFNFVNNCSKGEALISPRELQTMALNTLAFIKTNNAYANAYDVAANIAYEIGLDLIPKGKCVEFTDYFKPEIFIQPTVQFTDFCIIPSRHHTIVQIEHLLNLHELRHAEQDIMSKEQRYGGLLGAVLTGDAGVGKTKLIEAILHAKGYQHYPFKRNLPEDCSKLYFRMPASMSVSDKRELIRKASKNGIIVVSDEFNSMAIEPLILTEINLNAKAGFLFLTTQNPADRMEGRRNVSPAIQRRFVNIYIPSYTQAELVQIICQKGIRSIVQAEEITEAYFQAVASANTQHTQAPTFRQLETVIGQVLNASSQKNISSNIAINTKTTKSTKLKNQRKEISKPNCSLKDKYQDDTHSVRIDIIPDELTEKEDERNLSYNFYLKYVPSTVFSMSLLAAGICTLTLASLACPLVASIVMIAVATVLLGALAYNAYNHRNNNAISSFGLFSSSCGEQEEIEELSPSYV